MDLSQILNSENTILIALGCVCLCAVGFVLMSGLQFVGGFLGMFSSVVEIVFDVLSGGPVSWCGCLVLLFVCVGGAGGAYLLTQALASCGTPQALNLCSLFGR